MKHRWLGVAGPAAAIVLAIAPAGAQTGAPHPFDPIGAVMQHPRCLNCHQPSVPGNGEDGRPHRMKITRGADGFGAPAARCTACHRIENNDATSVPGAPHWGLPPVSMTWRGLGKAELCRALKDPSRNGGRDLAALVDHMDHDPLVIWAWSPGKGRAPAPGSHPAFMALLKTWADAGGPCPAP